MAKENQTSDERREPIELFVMMEIFCVWVAGEREGITSSIKLSVSCHVLPPHVTSVASEGVGFLCSSKQAIVHQTVSDPTG